MKREVMKLFWLSALVLCFAAAVFNAAGMFRTWKTGAVCSIEGASGDDLALLSALYPEIEWTAYAQRFDSVTVANSLLPARTAQAQVLTALGDPGRIAFFPLVSGRLPRAGEEGVCALDADTAFALFRSEVAEGNCVQVDNASLTVVGVVDVGQALLVTGAARDARLNRLAADSREELTVLAAALGAEIDPFALSGKETARLAGLLCAAPCLLLAGSVPRALRRYGNGGKYASTLLRWALFAGGVMAVLWCVPVRLLPARWSDLGFYARQVEAFRSRAVRLPDVRDVMLQKDIARVGIFSLLSCGALHMERKWLKCEKRS